MIIISCIRDKFGIKRRIFLVTGWTRYQSERFSGLHQFRFAFAFGGGGEVHGAEVDKEMVENRHQSVNYGRHFVPELSRNVQEESDQNPIGTGIRHGQHVVHRTSWASYSREI